MLATAEAPEPTLLGRVVADRPRTTAEAGDLIFADGFESGNTCRWTDSCPVPENDTCASPEELIEAVSFFGSTVAATDDYDLSCLGSGSRDTVHEFGLPSASSVLVTLTSVGPEWSQAMALRASANCTETSDIACVAAGGRGRYINKPSLAAGTYSVIVDGDSGSSGDYAIRYDTSAEDTTFGYWVLQTTGPYESIAGSPEATSVEIPITPIGAPTTDPGDEWSLPIGLPFAFDFFGFSYDSVNATSNLLLTFDTPPAGSQSYENDCLDDTAPTDAIAVFWDDGISHETGPSELWTMTQGSAPDRRFIIEFRNWELLDCTPLCYLLGVATNQQAILYENGDIELRYGPRQPPSISVACGTQHSGCSATIGIEGETVGGTDADTALCLEDGIEDGTVLYFVHPS